MAKDVKAAWMDDPWESIGRRVYIGDHPTAEEIAETFSHYHGSLPPGLVDYIMDRFLLGRPVGVPRGRPSQGGDATVRAVGLRYRHYRGYLGRYGAERDVKAPAKEARRAVGTSFGIKEGTVERYWYRVENKDLRDAPAWGEDPEVDRRFSDKLMDMELHGVGIFDPDFRKWYGRWPRSADDGTEVRSIG